ncbi:polymorphic toxin-type HINT domain-containing protein [Streptomyces fagopyri]|uniref:polymorphic toxin-type HINT domain-containing protein n=1 Tax=Streptomyces fagopyri TaxID=2662397 RepID=UPI003710E3B6
MDAGKAAEQVAVPANDAIQLGSAYIDTDSAAGLVVLTGQNSKTIAEQQRAVADAKNAAAEAQAAKNIADQAKGDAKETYQHAANAAQYAADARTYSKDALGYAADAAKAVAAASASLARTIDYDTQATTDAAAADKAAGNAEDYAKDARASAARSAATQAGHSIGNVFYVLDHIEKTGDPEVIKKTDGCDHWWNHLAYTGNCTMTTKIKYKDVADLYLCSAEGIDPQKLMCPTGATTYLGGMKTDELSQEVTHTISIAEWQDGVDPIDILFGSWITCAEKFTSGFKSGSWGGCAWASLDVASLFASKIIRPVAEALRAVDAAFVTGIGVRDALQALKTLKGVDAAAVAAIEREVQTYEEAVTACERNSFPGGTRVLMADGTRRPILEVRVGDLVLATDPASGRARPEPVTNTFRHRTDHLVDVSLAGGGTLTSTSGHRVYVAGHGWVHVSDLRVGDGLRTSDGALQSVTALHDRPGLAPRPVYDLTVDGLHTFYVRPRGGHSRDVLVHNCLNLVQDEGIEEAHTLREHVEPDDNMMAAEAIKKGTATRWNDEATAAKSVQAAFDAWIKKPSNVKRLDKWVKEQAHNPAFDPRHDLLDFKWQLRDQGSLGRVWVKDGVQGERTGNTVLVHLKYAGKHKPSKYVVYTSYPE